MMPYQTTLVFDKPLIRKAVWNFWRRSIGTTSILALALFTAFVVSMIASGDRSWRVGAGATAISLSALLMITGYVVHYRNSFAKLKAMGDPRATFTIDEKTFSISSKAGDATLPWSAVIEVWQFQDLWLLLFSRAQFVTLPLACLSPEMQSLIIERVRASGGKIR